jgi:signal transduction histidine kinase
VSISLRYRFIALVLLGAIAPLAFIGGLVARSGITTTTEQLRQELQEDVTATASEIERRWSYRMGDLLLLANNQETVAFISARRRPDEGEAEYLESVWSHSARDIPYVEFISAGAEVLWTLGTPATEGGRGGTDPSMTVVLPAGEQQGGRGAGTLRAYVRTASIMPDDAARAGRTGTRLLVRHSATGMRLAPGGELPVAAHGSSHFTHEGQAWVATRTTLDQPPVEIVAAMPIGARLAPYQRAARVGAGALALSAVVIAMATMLLTARTTRGMQRLTRTAEALGSGQLTARVMVDGNDEVARLGAAFNRMADSLDTTLHELAQQRALAAVGELSASLSHEVRNALTSVRIDLERAARRTEADEARSRLTQRALDNVTRLEHIVSGLLRVSRSGQVPMEPLDPVLPLRAAANAVGVQSDRGIIVDVPSDTAPFVTADGAALEQLFTNLMLNAVQAAPDTPVHVSLCVEGDWIEIRIRDDGPGISAADAERAFAAFYTTRPAGTGLGLSIARNIVRAHGGEIALEPAPHQGTVARVRLPAARIQTLQQQAGSLITG